MSKKAILAVSFGTLSVEAIEKSITSTENSFKVAFPECDVRRAFTSQVVIEKLADKFDIHVDNVKTALDKLAAEGYEEVYVQPISLVADKTYNQIKAYIVELAHKKEKDFKKIIIARPLLLSLGLKNHPDDYAIAIEAVKTQLPELGSDKAVVFMCNGNEQTEYAVLQLKLADAGIKNAFVYTSEGYPTLDGIIRNLQESKVAEVILAPFLLVASEHVMNYIAGDSADSAKSKLEAAGCKVSVHNSGLGENPAIQAIYVQHLKDAVRATTAHHGHHKKSAHGEHKVTSHCHK